ncbi:MAG: hypothetical protein HYT63_03060 [Candidatus Yanofskybacteria bacterium]|nr:hypothetical protein [Candidatus Yanofskybacteria bacterium]
MKRTRVNKNNVYKAVLFFIAFFVGTAITYGDWLIGLISGVIVVLSKEIQGAYEKGRRDGHKEALDNFSKKL